MPPTPRRIALLLHIVFSVGWLGAVLAYLPLTIKGLTSVDTNVVRSAYLAMEQIGWYVIVPLCLGSLLSGIVQSVGTEWGLFRHYWVATKLILTIASTAILLAHMPAVSQMAALATSLELPVIAPDRMRAQLVVHAAGGLVVLIVITALSVFKPWGRIRFGRS